MALGSKRLDVPGLAYKNAPAVSINSIQTGLLRKLVPLEGEARRKVHISTISSPKSVIQGCIEKEFYTLSIEIRTVNVVIKYYFGLKKRVFER